MSICVTCGNLAYAPTKAKIQGNFLKQSRKGSLKEETRQRQTRGDVREKRRKDVHTEDERWSDRL